MIAMPQASAPFSNAPSPATVFDSAAARTHMVESQLRPNQVTDLRILTAMGEIPRELFVPSYLVGIAYLDENIPLIAGRSLMQPMALARLLQAAEIKQQDRVLELAPATGYSTIVLTALSDHVIAVEPDAVLHKEAESNIAKYVPGSAVILAGAPVEGCISHTPFDVIFINGCVDAVPDLLLNQLAEGGRLVAVIRHYGQAHAAHTGQATLYRKTKDAISKTPLFDAHIPPAPGFVAPEGFVF